MPKRTPKLDGIGAVDLDPPKKDTTTPKKSPKAKKSRSVSRKILDDREAELNKLRKKEGLKPKVKLTNAEYTAQRRKQKIQVNLELSLEEKIELEKLTDQFKLSSDQKTIKHLIKQSLQGLG